MATALGVWGWRSHCRFCRLNRVCALTPLLGGSALWHCYRALKTTMLPANPILVFLQGEGKLRLRGSE